MGLPSPSYSLAKVLGFEIQEDIEILEQEVLVEGVRKAGTKHPPGLAAIGRVELFSSL